MAIGQEYNLNSRVKGSCWAENLVRQWALVGRSPISAQATSAGWSSLTAVDPWCWNPLSESRTNILKFWPCWSCDSLVIYSNAALLWTNVKCKKKLKCDICSHILISFPLFSSSSLFIYSLVIRHSMFELVAAHRGKFSFYSSTPLPFPPAAAFTRADFLKHLLCQDPPVKPFESMEVQVLNHSGRRPYK